MGVADYSYRAIHIYSQLLLFSCPHNHRLRISNCFFLDWFKVEDFIIPNYLVQTKQGCIAVVFVTICGGSAIVADYWNRLHITESEILPQ